MNKIVEPNEIFFLAKFLADRIWQMKHPDGLITSLLDDEEEYFLKDKEGYLVALERSVLAKAKEMGSDVVCVSIDIVEEYYELAGVFYKVEAIAV